jgi:ribosomal protein S6
MANTEETKAESQVYEIGYLVLPSIGEDKVGGVVSKIKEAVAASGGQELEGEEPFMIDLSYTMSKTVGASKYVANEAYLGWLKFEIEPSKALEVKMALEKIDELLRFLLIKAPRETHFTFEKAKALLAEKEAKEAEAEREDSPVEAPVVE